MDTGRTILTRGLPKTGQSTSYDGNDDGGYEAGWWRGRSIAENKARFVAKTFDFDDVVLDLATGLMWPADFNEKGCNDGNSLTWANALLYANALDFAGFTDWRLSNIFELISICNLGGNNPAMYTEFFKNFGEGNFITSTTMHYQTAFCFYVYLQEGWYYEQLKSAEGKFICVRGGV